MKQCKERHGRTARIKFIFNFNVLHDVGLCCWAAKWQLANKEERMMRRRMDGDNWTNENGEDGMMKA